jgi:4-hydroxybenzoate polyprenyltransferase
MVLTSVYIGLGAGYLGMAMAKLAGYDFSGLYFGLYFFFAQFMHLLNGFVDRGSSRANDPDRSVFLNKYKKVLIACGLISFLFSLSGAYLAGPWVLALILFLTACRIAYDMPVPNACLKKKGIMGVKDLPMAKSLAISLGWASLLTVPLIAANPPVIQRTTSGLVMTATLFALVFLNVLIRTLVMDFQDWLGDRMFGTRTSVTLLGWKRASKVVWSLILFWALFIAVVYCCLPGSPVLLLLLPGPLLNAFALRYLHKNIGMGGYMFDFCLDGQFLLAGALILLWSR